MGFGEWRKQYSWDLVSKAEGEWVGLTSWSNNARFPDSSKVAKYWLGKSFLKDEIILKCFEKIFVC